MAKTILCNIEGKKLTKNCHIIKTLKHKEFLEINKKVFNNPKKKNGKEY